MPRLTSFLPPIWLLNEFDGVGSLLVDLTGPGLSHLDLAGAILSREDMQCVFQLSVRPWHLPPPGLDVAKLELCLSVTI